MTEVERQTLSGRPVLEAERRVLEAALGQLRDVRSGPDQRLEMIAKEVARHGRVAIFTVHLGAAHQLLEALTKGAGGRLVVGHLADMPSEKAAAAVTSWQTTPAAILVCDRSGQEGLNLQSADCLLHHTLPWSPNELEQRIGRVDRYGEADAAREIVVLDSPGRTSYQDSWITLLLDGFHAFERSLSALQYDIDVLLPRVWRAALREGPQGLRDIAAEVAASLRDAEERIAEQDALDSIEVGWGVQRMLEEMNDTEDTWGSLQAAAENLAGAAPGSYRLFIQPNSKTPLIRTYEWISPTGRGPLLPLEVLSQYLKPGLGRAGTWNRQAALNRPGLAVFRIGDPFVDGLYSVANSDDRGQATVMWRARHAWEDQATLFFGFDFLVEADIDGAVGLLPGIPGARRALRCRVDGWLPPFLSTLWVRAFGESAVEDAPTREFLEARYDKSEGDVNLSVERLGPLRDLIGGEHDWEIACRQARGIADRELLARHDLRRVCPEAAERARNELAVEAEQFRARQQATGFVTPVPEERVIGDAAAERLVAGILAPTMRLVSTAAVVMSNVLPARLLLFDRSA